ncbi:hypothetical protein SLS53_001638 [Cytospora paraplurivora]|uniref:Berberine/berberine-like domain-containing protein n=1 Tax=Cytospora paraplurivora TaxID=2898453 RepID=A0AAN9UFK4_9PEZI
MQVVLANGSIIDANATSNAHLFPALKGGQSNFGVVTSFDINTYPKTKFWGGAIQYPETADTAQLAAFTAFKTHPYDPFAEVEQTYVYFEPNITSVLTFQSIPPPPGANTPQNSLPFSSDSAPQNNVVLALFSMYWPNAKGSTVVESSVRNLTRSVQQLVGEEENFKYLNYAASWQDPIGSYGEATVEQLRRTATLYDPDAFFQRVVSGGFKLRVGY